MLSTAWHESGPGSIHLREVAPLRPPRLHPRTWGPSRGPLPCPYPPLRDPNQPLGFSHCLYCDFCHIRAPVLPTTPPLGLLHTFSLTRPKQSPHIHQPMVPPPSPVLRPKTQSQTPLAPLWFIPHMQFRSKSWVCASGTLQAHPSLGSPSTPMALTSDLLHSSLSYSHTPGPASR